MNVILGYDPATLDERVDLLAAGQRLNELGDMRSFSAIIERTELLRLVGRTDEAWDCASEAVRLARFTGSRKDLLGARARRARIASLRGRHDEAHTELTNCVDEARAHGWRALESFCLKCRGRVSFTREDYGEALADFKAAVGLLADAGASADDIEVALIAVAVTESFLDEQRVG